MDENDSIFIFDSFLLISGPLLGDGQSHRSFPLVPPWWPGQH